MLKTFDSRLRKSNTQKLVKKGSILKINKIILIILLVISLSQSQNQESPEDSIKKLESYIPNVQDFQNLDSSEKSDLWEMSKTGGAEARITREVLVYKLAEKISADRLRDYKYERLLAGGVEGTKIERMKGFGDPSLRWSDSEKGKNIIGDGKVWLNLEDIPININEIEYKDNKFILRTKEKAELVIEPESINKDGEINNIGNYQGKDKKISLSDLTFIKGEKGQVILTKDGFSLKEDARIYFNGIDFKKNSLFNGETTLKILSDKDFIVRGVDVTKKGVVALNALYLGDPTSSDDFFYETHVIFGGDAEPKLENYIKINGNDITTGGKGTLEVLGPIGNVVVDGDFSINNGEMKIRVKGDEIFGPRAGSFLNKDDYLTSINLGKKLVIPLPVIGGVSETFEPFLNLRVEEGKVTGISAMRSADFIDLKDKTAIDDFLKKNPKITGLISSLQASDGNLNVLRRTADSGGFAVGNEKYNFPEGEQVFTGKDTFAIDNIKSAENLDKSFLVRSLKDGSSYVFEDGPGRFTAGTKSDGTSKADLIIVENKYARTFEGVETVDEFLDKLDEAEFVFKRQITSGLTNKDRVFSNLEGNINSNSRLSEQQKSEFITFLKDRFSEINKDNFNGATITSYWYPTNDEEKRRPKIEIKFPDGYEKTFMVDEAYIEYYKKMLLSGAKFLKEQPFNKLLDWCATIGEKLDRICKE